MKGWELKVDLAMWAKNGARFLPIVLKRIEEVIPQESISQKILVDDKSRDGTREIAREFNWTVYDNPTGFVNGGANEALRHVTTPFFVSIEQDVILAREWWDRIPKYMEEEDVAIAQGIRVSDNPALKVLDLEITLESLPKDVKFGRIPDQFWSIDNNIYRTDILKRLGGFPNRDPVAVDFALLEDLAAKTNYRWVVDPTVVSYHIRSGVIDYLKHESRWLTLLEGTQPIDYMSLAQVVGMVVASPIRGFQIAVTKRYPQASVLHPFRRLLNLRAYLVRRARIRGSRHCLANSSA